MSAALPGVSRPSLALVAGLLAVPGSTIACDLPAVGLYIGLPADGAPARVHTSGST